MAVVLYQRFQQCRCGLCGLHFLYSCRPVSAFSTMPLWAVWFAFPVKLSSCISVFNNAVVGCVVCISCIAVVLYQRFQQCRCGLCGLHFLYGCRPVSAFSTMP